MSQNTGTLITSTIRPNDSLDKISVIFANEAKGGHHAYALYSDMTTAQVKFPDRFIFGMLATVYNDSTPANNATYILKYGKVDTDPTNILNWEIFSGGGDYDEWQNSVISRTSSIPTIITTGDRYLIIGSTGGTSLTASENTWLNHEDNIAEYDSTVPTWNFLIPFEGVTVRVDNEKSVLYKYTGSYSYGGRWVKEYINQVYNLTASSTDGINYTAIANLVGYYKPSVFYINFMTASAGPNANININNLGTASIKKVTGNNISDIAAGDLNTTVIYQLVYDGTYFQTPILTAVNQIGPAENGGSTYTGGLYTDFTSTTQIGTPIDRFNQILAALVPPSAPNLQSINGYALNSVLYSSCKLSFPPTTGESLLNYYNSATGSGTSYGNVTLDGSWGTISTIENNGYKRLGVFAATSSNTDKNITIYGTLNYNIPVNTATPTPAYAANSFANGHYGNIYLAINGLTVSTVSLTASYGATDSTLNLTRPGLSMSSATSSKFPGGSVFELFYNRTGNWYIPNTSMYGPFVYNSAIGMTANQYGLTRGYNYVTVTQVTPTTVYSLARVEFVLDDNTTAISAQNTQPNINYQSLSQPTPGFNYYLFGNVKYLSGIGYYTTLTQVAYQASLYNVYGGVYSDSTTAIQISDITPTGSGLPAPATSMLNSVNNSILPLSGAGLNFAAYPLSVNLSISGNFRRINDTLAVSINLVKKPLLTNGYTALNNSTGASASLYGIMFDNIASTSVYGSQSQFEGFDDEQYRLQYLNGAYDSYTIIPSYSFTSSTSLTLDSNSLQVINSKLQYPSQRFDNFGTFFSGSLTASNPNANNSNANYSGLLGVRYYIRKFGYTASNTSVFTIQIQGSGTLTASNANFNTLSNTGNFAVQIKLPGNGYAYTGWLDISKPYNPSSFSGADNDGVQSGAAANINGTPFGINIGTKTTANSNGYVLLKVTAPSGWIGSLLGITFSYF